MPYTVYMREGTTATSPQRTQVEPVSLRAPQASSGLHTTSPVPAREIGTSGSDHTLSPAGPGPSRTKRQRLSALQRAPRPLPENAREPPKPTDQTHAPHCHQVRRDPGRLAGYRPTQYEGGRSTSGNVTGSDQPSQALPHRSVSA